MPSNADTTFDNILWLQFGYSAARFLERKTPQHIDLIGANGRN